MVKATRLAESEIDINTSVSVSYKTDFSGATLHGHDFYELDLILSGSGQTTLNNHIREVHAGQVFF